MKYMKNYFFCGPFKESCAREDIFSKRNGFFNENNVLWKNWASVTTDGAATLNGIKKRFQGKATDIAPHVKLLHCITHRQAIAAKKLEPGVHKVLQDDISVVNFIKTSPSNSSIFTRLCNEMGVTMKISCTTQRLAGYLVAKCLKELSNFTHFSFTKRQVFHIC